MKRILVAIAGAFLALSQAQAETAQPLLVELFTAQGCGSCPPADEVLAHLATRSDVVALAFHVDYWDSGGWRDKFALAESKTRQQGYRRALHHDQVFTPQMVINGTVDTPGQLLEGVDKILALLRARMPPGPVITLARRAAHLEVDIAAAPAWKDAVVWMAVFDAEHTVDVKRGENRGKTIVNVNIVRELRNLGVTGGEAWTQTVDLSAVTPQQGVAVWLQPKDQSPVAGAAMLPPG